MLIKRQDHDSVSILTFEGEDQIQNPEPLRDTIMDICREDRKNILIDMGNVTFISSSVLGYFISSYQHLKEKDGHLKLLNVQPCVYNVFELTRIDRIIEIYNDRQTALDSFK